MLFARHWQLLGSALAVGCAPAAQPRCVPGPAPSLEHFRLLSNQAPPREISGVLLSLPDSGPIPYAMVTVQGTSIEAITDSTGRFRLTAVPVGTIDLRLAMLGYFPLFVPVTLPPERGLVIKAGLGRSCLVMNH